MQKVKLFTILCVCLMLSPASIYSRGNRERNQCGLSIINNTGTLITQIILSESESENKTQVFNRSVENNASTVINITRDVLYNIILIDINERQYAKSRLVWNGETGEVVFELRDILDRNIWDRARRVFLWPLYR